MPKEPSKTNITSGIIGIQLNLDRKTLFLNLLQKSLIRMLGLKLRTTLKKIKDRNLWRNIQLINKEDIQSLTMLGVDQELKWTLDDDGLHIEVPEKKPCDYAVTFKIKWA
ncbi:MAG: alpha-L-fucosidase C-terminal domain-containing protein [Promethearchaeota archaeon]